MDKKIDMIDIHECIGCLRTYNSEHQGKCVCGINTFRSKSVPKDSSELLMVENITLNQKFEQKYNKLEYDYVPPECEEMVMECFQYGANKYKKDSWKTYKNPQKTLYDALRRHLNRWRRGQLRDKESKLMHSAHIATIGIMMLWHDLKKEEYFESKTAEAVINLMKKILCKNENWDMVEEEVKRWFT